MSRTRMLALLVVLAAAALPAQANAARFGGIVIAKQQGALVLAGANGAGITVRVAGARVALGDRIALQGTRLRDGTLRGAHLRVLGRVHATTIRGVIVRRLRTATRLATGRSVITIHRGARLLASAADDGGLAAGDAAQFRVRFDDDQLEEAAATPLAPGSNVKVEGVVVAVSPLVVSVEGLPITITEPAGLALPAGLAAGMRVELTVQPGAGNVFTLVSIGAGENEDDDEGAPAATPTPSATTPTPTPTPTTTVTGDRHGDDGDGGDGGGDGGRDGRH